MFVIEVIGSVDDLKGFFRGGLLRN